VSQLEYAELRPGYRFCDGKLYAGEEERAYVLHGWPKLLATRERWSDPRQRGFPQWEVFEPEFRVVLPPRPANRAGFAQPAPQCPRSSEPLLQGLDGASSALKKRPVWEQRRRAFEGFRATIPEEVARLVEPLRSHQWSVLQLLRDHEAAFELMETNPALVFAIALAKLSEGGMRFRAWNPPIHELLRRKRCEILEHLDLPGTRRAVRLLSRVPTRSLHPGIVGNLGTILENPEAAKLAAHLPALNMGVVKIIASCVFGKLASPRFLEELSAVPREFHYPFAYDCLFDIATLPDDPRSILDGPPFRSISEMESTRRQLYEEVFGPPLSASKFPCPPIPGTGEIEPVTTIDELDLEGESQSNCVPLLIDLVLEGKVYFYRVLTPERATLAIACNSSGTWTIDEIMAAKNTAVSQTTVDAVQGWLDGWHQPDLTAK